MQRGIANGFRNNQRSQSETAGSREVTRAPRPLHPMTPEGPRESWALASAGPEAWRKEGRSLTGEHFPTHEAEPPKAAPACEGKEVPACPCPLLPPQRALRKGAHCLKPWCWE